MRKTTVRPTIEIVVLTKHTVQGERVDILAVIRPSHVFLTKTNGVFSFGNTIELFKLAFGDALHKEQDQYRLSNTKTR
jgi:hypothetical protein